MVRGLPARSRLLSVVTGAAIAALMAGCSTTPPAPTVSGKNLTVYYSTLPKLANDQKAQDVIHAEQLAFDQFKGQVRGFTLRFLPLKKPLISDNARTAIEDKSSVAYVGEIEPRTSTDSLGITNAQDLLQVSPAEGPPVPTDDFQSFSTYGRTFASMAPGSAQEAQAIAGQAAGKAFVRDFRTMYGRAPSPQAILGYAATAAVLTALQRAGSAASNRGTVRDDFFALRRVPLRVGPGGPVLGTYTINGRGTVTITPASTAP
ncbi:MAG: hypothetical protein ACJ764_05175 [Solirubrobacteraceae bacterium]